MFLRLFALLTTTNRTHRRFSSTVLSKQRSQTFSAMSSSSEGEGPTSPSINPKLHSNEFLVSSRDLNPTHQIRGFNSTYALIIVNSETVTAPIIRRIWNNFDYRICADGGANRLYDSIIEPLAPSDANDISTSPSSSYIPSAIKGDLDSIRDDVRSYYSSAGSDIVEDDDQDTNDLEKCIVSVIAEYGSRQWPDGQTKKPLTIVVLGAFGGRFDQEISGIHALYKWHSSVDRIVLLGGENVVTLLSPGKHTIVPVKGIEGPTCGLLPLGGKVERVTTKGLHWDLQGQSLEFGGLVSSSNRMDGEKVDIETSDYVVWMNIVTIPVFHK